MTMKVQRNIYGQQNRLKVPLNKFLKDFNNVLRWKIKEQKIQVTGCPQETVHLFVFKKLQCSVVDGFQQDEATAHFVNETIQLFKQILNG